MANILIVEDDKDLNNAYGIILRAQGYNVALSFNGKEALAKLKDFTPDLILLDLLMPIMGGLEFLQNYRDSKGPKARVLIFTNMENSPEVNEAYKLGADKVVIKSWTAPHNLAKVVADSLTKPPTPRKKLANKT